MENHIIIMEFEGKKALVEYYYNTWVNESGIKGWASFKR